MKYYIRCSQLILMVILVTSCSETRTFDAAETFKNWSGSNPPSDLKLINGQFWKSGHWSNEYIVYLELKPSKIWWEDFVRQNSLSPDNDSWSKPSEAPIWFKPPTKSIRYKNQQLDQGSRYFRDSITGICYIYEIQL